MPIRTSSMKLPSSATNSMASTGEATLDRLDRLMRELDREAELIERRLGPSFIRWLPRTSRCFVPSC